MKRYSHVEANVKHLIISCCYCLTQLTSGYYLFNNFLKHLIPPFIQWWTFFNRLLQLQNVILYSLFFFVSILRMLTFQCHFSSSFCIAFASHKKRKKKRRWTWNVFHHWNGSWVRFNFCYQDEGEKSRKVKLW